MADQDRDHAAALLARNAANIALTNDDPAKQTDKLLAGIVVFLDLIYRRLDKAAALREGTRGGPW